MAIWGGGGELIAIPADPLGPAAVTFRRVRLGAGSRSGFTGQELVGDWGGEYLEASVQLPPLTHAQATAWVAFLQALKGRVNVFQFRDEFAAAFPESLLDALGLQRVWRLKTNQSRWTVEKARYFGISFECREAVGTDTIGFIDDDDLTDRTGVWVATPRQGTGWANESRDDIIATNPQPNLNGLWDLPTSPIGNVQICITTSLRAYPWISLFDLLFSAGFSSALIEWYEARAFSDYVMDHIGNCAGIADIYLKPHDGYIGYSALDESSYGKSQLYSVGEDAALTLTKSAGGLYRDNLIDTIPPELSTSKFMADIWHSMFTGDGVHYNSFNLWNAGIALYRNAVRINCGGDDVSAPAGTGLVNSVGQYTWGADRGYTGGAEQARAGSGLYASERRGTSFRYVLRRSVFALQHPTSKSRISLRFKEQEFASAGQRVFDVDITPGAGAAPIHAISGLDLYALYGNAAHTLNFEVTVNNRTTDGQIYIDFCGVTGEASCNAIAQEPMVVEYES